MEQPHRPIGEGLRVAVVIEDDADIRELVATVLQQSGFSIHAAADGASGVDAVRRHRPDIVTLDLGLPGIDGLEVVRRIRLENNCYIVVVSARTDEAETLMALNAGADDFVTKPFRPRELRARITAMLRRPREDQASISAGLGAAPVLPSATTAEAAPERPGSDSGPDENEVLRHDDLELESHTRSVRIGTRDIDLTRTEFELLRTLLLSGRRVRTKAHLVRHLRSGTAAGPAEYVSEADERAVEVHIGNLRRKLGQSGRTAARIETVRGVGYRMADQLS